MLFYSYLVLVFNDIPLFNGHIKQNLLGRVAYFQCVGIIPAAQRMEGYEDILAELMGSNR